MHGPNRATGRMILVCFCLGLVLCCVQESMAQLDRISVSVSGGAGYVSLEDWTDFWSSITHGHYEKDKLGIFLESRVVYHFTDKHAVALNVESINTSASLYHAMALTGPTGDTSGYASSVVEWDFSAIPVGLSYEFYPMRSDESTSPFFGLGVSYFFSELEYKSWFLHPGFFGDLGSEGTRDGEGYGVHAYVGVQCQLTEQLLVVSRLRGRYSDGMAFTDKERAIKVEFTGVDFTIGLGWRF